MSYPNPTSGGPPLRALAMVLIALAIVFAGLGAMSLSSSDSGTSTAAESSTGATASAAAQATAATSASVTSAPVTTAPATTAPATTAPATTTVAANTTAPTSTKTPTTTAATVNRAVPIRVLNNSLVAGLAGRTAEQLAADGWTNVSSGNYSGGTIAKTTVYYGNSPGERDAALAIAAELGATAEPKSAGVGDSTAGVVVILTGN
ncbi:LytR C-terminal domain-containing protein [Nocardia sp. NPDC050710]|uniref:LytR C-terminal domain-containing protein n=1 Tax=Nocardia sp. NPDC050710 TaxID=3157220 RepID=UPI0033DDFFFC